MRFGSFEVDEMAFQLREHGRPVRLERIPMELNDAAGAQPVSPGDT